MNVKTIYVSSTFLCLYLHLLNLSSKLNFNISKKAYWFIASSVEWHFHDCKMAEKHSYKFDQNVSLVFFSHPTENLQQSLEDQLQQFEKVKVIRMPRREGLVRARLRGAEISRGEVLTFLDSHCEATEGWLEPLLVRIAQDRSNVVCPVIEVINADDFGYQTSDVIHERGGFSWDLFFTWKAIPEEERKRREDETDYIRHVTNT